MFRAMISPIFRSIDYFYSLWYNAPTMLPAGKLEAEFLRFQVTGRHYTTSCNTQSSAHEDGLNYRPKHFELIGIINKPFLLHLVGRLYYLYQWCTVKQISNIWFYLKMQFELILRQNSVSLESLFFFKVVLWTKCHFSQLLSNLKRNVLIYAQVILIINQLRQIYKNSNCAANLNTSIFRTSIEIKPLAL